LVNASLNKDHGMSSTLTNICSGMHRPMPNHYFSMEKIKNHNFS
jgi:hypothetical protein